MFEIKTADYNKEYQVLIDGNHVAVRHYGAGTALMLEQTQRRIQFLAKKLEDGIANDADLDEIEKLETKILDMYSKLFVDKTPNKNFVKQWIQDTPVMVLMAVIDDIRRQVDEDTVDEPKEVS